MTEQEIISYLKENKNKGVAFDFMPQEARKWCIEHSNEEIFHIFHHSSWNGKCSISCRDSAIYCLDEEYQPETQFEPHWEEFEVDEEGCFNFCNVYSFWHQWSAFLALNKDKYNAFGGWLYVDSDKKPTWYMSPRIDGDGRVYSYSPIDVESKPAIPKKVRFWRYKE